MMFDRVIVLSEGYTIYSGPPLHVRTYFEQFGLKMRKYSNPADKVSIIASEPKSVLTESFLWFAEIVLCATVALGRKIDFFERNQS